MTHLELSCFREGPGEGWEGWSGGDGREEADGKRGGRKPTKWQGWDLGKCSSQRELGRTGGSQGSRVAPLLGEWGCHVPTGVQAQGWKQSLTDTVSSCAAFTEGKQVCLLVLRLVIPHLFTEGERSSPLRGRACTQLRGAPCGPSVPSQPFPGSPEAREATIARCVALLPQQPSPLMTACGWEQLQVTTSPPLGLSPSFFTLLL